MDSLNQIGQFLIIVGILIACVGGILLFSDRLGWLGRLPGDILIERDNFTLYMPITTSILLSLLLSFLLYIMGRF